jgi:cytochrome c
MSDELGFNKIAGAVLATGLAIVGLGELSNIVFQYEPPAKPGYAIAISTETGGAAAAVEAPIDWGTELPKADVAAGKTITAKCQSCHNFDQGGPNMTGPNLYGVLGRPPGSHPGFAYSDGMKAFAAKQPIWDYEHINDFITAPQKYIDGTKMTFVGLKQRQDRINVIAYLHTLGSALPIPKPNPAATATAAGGAGASGAAASGAAAPAAAAKK